MARTLISVPPNPKPGEVIELRATIAHPMETGLRQESPGLVAPRNILTFFTCKLDGVTVFSAELYPAVAANPLLAFSLKAERSGTLTFTWEGDNGFSQTETVPLRVA